MFAIVIGLFCVTTIEVGAQSGNALALDGVDDYASVTDNASLDLGTVDGQGFTIETWFYVPDLNGEGLQTLIYKQNSYALFVNFHTASPDQLFFRLWSPALPVPGYITLFATASDLAVGWHHAAAVFDNQPGGGSDIGAVYLDGVRVGLGTGLSFNPGIGNSASPLNIGAYLGVNPFHGWLDEVRLSDTVRYSGTSYTVPTGAFSSDANTRGLWHFDETPGATSFSDASSYGNTLSGINGAQTINPAGDPRPTVASIIRLNPPFQTNNAQFVTWLVNFSEPVMGIDLGDFTLVDVNGGVLGEFLGNVSAGGGSQVQVTANTGGGGVGDLRLDVIYPGATIADLAGNALTNSFTTGQVFTVDKVPPTVVSINRHDPAEQTTSATSVVYRVTFSEPVMGVATDDFTLVDVSGTITGESITSVSASSGTTIDVTVNTGSGGSGDLRLNVNVPGATILDQALNSLSASFVSGQTYAIVSALSDLLFRQVSAGYSHTVAIKTDGTLWAWGGNLRGQLGDGTTADKSSPVQIGAATNWQSVSAGVQHTVTVRSDGTLWAWGDNFYGQLGDGTTANKSSPVQIGSATNWQVVAAGSYYTIAARSDGTLWTWGYNGSGQLGDGTTSSRYSPVQLSTATNWHSASAGWSHTVAVKADGTLWAWGNNGSGQLGDGTTTNRHNPVQVGAATNWQSVAAGRSHTVAIQTDGTLWAWGNGSSNLVQIGSATNWQSVAAGTGHSVAIQTDGTLWAWGANLYGQLGDGTTVTRSTPVQLSATTNWLAVSAGGIHSVALQTDGTLWSWGGNGSGQSGNGTFGDKSNPVRIGSATNWQILVASLWGYHNVALQNDESLWAWGGNSNGQLGDGTTHGKNSPARAGTTTWRSVAAGASHTTAVQGDGTLWAWGDNAYGQLGDGTITDRTSPIQIGFATNWQSMAAGNLHNVAIRMDGTLWAWGYNSFGQLGDGTAGSKSSPVRIGTATNWQSVAAGSHHTVAAKTDGTLWSWGLNQNGQLGDGTTSNIYGPVQIGTATNWQSVTAGSDHTVAVKTDGTLWAWGENGSGQLGDGTATNRYSPVQIGTATNWLLVDGGMHHTIAITTAGTLWAWGWNGSGQLGDGTSVNKASPVQIGAAINWQSVAAGRNHTVAIKTDGTLWAWGSNQYGQLGDGTGLHYFPVKIGVPIILEQPTGLTNALGTTAIFSVTPSGSQSLAYQWQKNGIDFVNDGNITGVTTPSLTLNNIQTSNAGNYTVVVSNTYGSVTSAVAVLNVVVPQITIANTAVTEGQSGTVAADFAIALNPSSSVPVTVNFATADGSATVANDDYLPTNGVLTFAPGESNKIITVLVNGDTQIEPDETFLVVLSNPTNAALAVTQAVGTILNDDIAPPVLETAAIDISWETTPSGFKQNTGMAGWEFALHAPVQVVRLGLFDHAGDGLEQSHQVGIWTTNGVLQVQTTIPSGVSAELIDGFRYVSVPVTILMPGSYVIGAFFTNAGPDRILDSPTSATMVPQMSFVQPRFVTSPVFAFPAIGQGAGNGTNHFGPNLRLIEAGPSLTVFGASTNIQLSWPISSAGFRVEKTDSLSPPIVWAGVTNAPTIIGNKYQVTLDKTNETQFFRLIKP